MAGLRIVHRVAYLDLQTPLFLTHGHVYRIHNLSDPDAMPLMQPIKLLPCLAKRYDADEVYTEDGDMLRHAGLV